MKRLTSRDWKTLVPDPFYNRLAELEDKLESGLLIELPCKIGDTVYGIDYTYCADKDAADEKTKRKIYVECVKKGGRCKRCKYSRLAIEEFVCTNIQISEDPMLVVGEKMESYTVSQILTSREAAEVRLRELQKLRRKQ